MVCSVEILPGYKKRRIEVRHCRSSYLQKDIFRSEYGYGPGGSPPKIPGGATLVFDVELFDFHGEDISKDKVSKKLEVDIFLAVS